MLGDAAHGATTFEELGRYDTDPPSTSVQTAAEIVAFESDTVYVHNIGAVDVVDISELSSPTRVAQLLLPGEPTSVAVNRGSSRRRSCRRQDPPGPGAVLTRQ